MQFEDCLQWVKRYMQSVGYTVTSCRFFPETEHWYFYEADGHLVMRLRHDTMEAMWDRLRQPVVAALTQHEADVNEYLEELKRFRDEGKLDAI